MLYRAIKYQVDKGPVDAVTGKAKRTLNDSHLLREDIDYSAMVTIATGLPPTLEPGSVSPVCLTCSSDSERPGEERSRGSAVSH